MTPSFGYKPEASGLHTEVPPTPNFEHRRARRSVFPAGGATGMIMREVTQI